MRSFAVLFIALCLLLTACGSGKTDRTIPADTTPPTRQETTAEPETTAPTHSEFYDPEIPVEDVIAYFNEVCLNAEMENSGDASVLQKWTTPIYYYLKGSLTREDYLVLEQFVQWLNSLEGFPGMYIARDLGQSNMDIHFCDQEQLLDIMGSSFTDTDGAVTFWYEDDVIYEATICIRTDLDQTLRNSVILEELYNSLGPIADTDLREDSIIYSGYSEPQELTDMDKLILQLLYHPDMQCGMTAGECAEVIRKLYY